MAAYLIAGCGQLGCRLAQIMVAQGHRVYGLRRNTARLPSGILPVEADLTQMENLKNLPGEIEQVFYTAAAPSRNEDDYRKTYVDGLQNLLTVLQAGGRPLPRVFFTSSTAVYGQQQGEWVDETSPAQPEKFTGKILREAEELLWSRVPGSVSVRLSGVYGPGRHWMIRRVLRGDPIQTDPPSYTNRIHLWDAARALYHLSHFPHPSPLYLATDDDPAPVSQVFSWIAHRLGLPASKVRSKPGTATQRNKRCRNARLKETGFQFQFPSFREGYEQVLVAAPPGSFTLT